MPDKSNDSEDDRPIVITLRQEKGQSLNAQQIQDCKEGPLGEKAVGVTIAKTFDGVQFRATIDSFRTARKRFYYHVTYSDGDEEELSQRELRDGFVLGLSKEIKEQWVKYIGAKKDTEGSEKGEKSQDESSGGESSDYGNKDYNEEVRSKRKQRKENRKRSIKKKTHELSETMLPQPGDKTASAEAFAKLDGNQKRLVAEKVNRKTKKVLCFCHVRITVFIASYNFIRV